MGITAIGAGVLNVLTSGDQPLGAPIRWLTTGAAALTLLTIGLLELTLRRAPDEPTDHRISVPLKLATAALALALGPWRALGPTALLGALLVLVLVHMTYGAIVWFRQELAEAAGGEAPFA